MTESAVNTRRSRSGSELVVLVAPFVGLAALSVHGAIENRWVVNADGIAHIRAAIYYATGQWDLVVSGYWAPLMSWLMVPFLGLVGEPVFAARIVMAISALVFLLGAVSVFRRTGLPPVAVNVGAWIVVFSAAGWSAQHVHSDMLMAGLLSLAAGRLLSPLWVESRRIQIGAGLLAGAAYYAKGIAFPVSVGLLVALPTLLVLLKEASARAAARSALVSLGAFLALAGPWAIMLSAKYGEPVFATSGRYLHAFTGPRDQWDPDYRYELYTFHRPQPGRVTLWEEPSMVEVPEWSPLTSGDDLRHQLRTMYWNTFTITENLAGFDWFHTGVFAVLLAFVAHRPWRRNLVAERWRWGLVVILAATVFYLPFHCDVIRYYLFSYVFLVTASLGLVSWLTRDGVGRRDLVRAASLGLVFVSFVRPAVGDYRKTVGESAVAGYGAGAYAAELAERLEAAGVRGPIAGGGRPNGLGGMLVAFYLDVPWYGNDQRANVDDFLESGAGIIVVDRESTIADELEAAPGVFDLDGSLFETGGEARAFPWRVFRSSG